MAKIKHPFDVAMVYLSKNEGGFSDHESDSGGATKYGITLSLLERWRGAKCTAEDVKHLNKTEAECIYFKWFWRPLMLDKIAAFDPQMAIAIFDMAVLFGASTAAVRCQRVLAKLGFSVKEDGILGLQTVGALARTKRGDFLPKFQDEFRSRVETVVAQYPKNEVFKKGWLNRIDRIASLIA